MERPGQGRPEIIGSGEETDMKCEFTEGAFKFLKDLIKGSSVTLAVIYTLGHIVIAMSVVSVMTGASLFEAGMVALIEPAINGVWFYVLHKAWKSLYAKE